MNNKVTVIGDAGSGKTTYLAGMYRRMSCAGYRHFTIEAVDSNQDKLLEQMWERLCYGEFPEVSYNSQNYSFRIVHNYKPLCNFDWLDYSGSVLVDPDHNDRKEFIESVRSSDCLLLVLDGTKFDIEAEDESEYEEKLARKIKFDGGVRNAFQILYGLSEKGIQIPPICIVITKCDLIDSKYRNAIERVLKGSMWSLFDGTDILILTSVSLGENITKGRPNPFCIEEPIAFAILIILIKYLNALSDRKSENLGIVNKTINFINTKLLYSDEIRRAGDEVKTDALKLIELFDVEKDIFVKGTKYNFRKYMRKFFYEINS